LIDVIWDKSFKRIYKKKIKNDNELKKKFWNATTIFCNDPFNSILRTHKLTGKLEGSWAFSCSYDCRVIFRFINKGKVLLIDIGSHEEVY
jgi:mRNA-degrading endonuclease YafQ of YafQ-DinJ toxin-antitoxin module